MGEAVTENEIKFIEILDDWYTIFPDGVHVDLELRDVYFARTLKEMDREELMLFIDMITESIESFTLLLENMTENPGSIRESWVSDISVVINDFLAVGDLTWDAYRNTLH